MKHHKLRLEENIPVNRKGQTRRALYTPKARRRSLNRLPVDGSKLHKVARDHGLVLSHVDREGRDRVLAVEHEASVGRVILCARDALVICRDDGVGQQHERRARVRDGGVRGRGGRAAVGADGEALGCELPEALRRVGGDEGDVARVLCRVEEAKVVVAGLRDVIS